MAKRVSLKTESTKIPIEDVVSGFWGSTEDDGVTAYGGKLVCRPAYQRDYRAEINWQKKLIDSIIMGYKIPEVMWDKANDVDKETYNLMDGQQRILTICRYFNNEFSWIEPETGKPKLFKDLRPDDKEQFLKYTLDVCMISGDNEEEKRDWFRRINSSSNIKMTTQEIRNSFYDGPWLTHAKKVLSKADSPIASKVSGMFGKGIKDQSVLEFALELVCAKHGMTNAECGGDRISEYMCLHRNDPDAKELINFLLDVCYWIADIFGDYASSKYGLLKCITGDIPSLYMECKDKKYDAVEIRTRFKHLLEDEEVTNKKGIFEYLLTGRPNKLNLRAFSDELKLMKYEQQGGICPDCGGHFDFEEMEADHIIPWSKGGKTDISNLQMRCKKCNREKGAKII